MSKRKHLFWGKASQTSLVGLDYTYILLHFPQQSQQCVRLTAVPGQEVSLQAGQGEGLAARLWPHTVKLIQAALVAQDIVHYRNIEVLSFEFVSGSNCDLVVTMPPSSSSKTRTLGSRLLELSPAGLPPVWQPPAWQPPA